MKKTLLTALWARIKAVFQPTHSPRDTFSGTLPIESVTATFTNAGAFLTVKGPGTHFFTGTSAFKLDDGQKDIQFTFSPLHAKESP